MAAYVPGTKYFVVCRNMSEFITYRNTKIKQLDRNKQPYRILDFVFVDDPIKLRGCQNIHGVFYGNWKQHPNIGVIIQQIIICNVGVNPSEHILPDVVRKFIEDNEND